LSGGAGQYRAGKGAQTHFYAVIMPKKEIMVFDFSDSG